MRIQYAINIITLAAMTLFSLAAIADTPQPQPQPQPPPRPSETPPSLQSLSLQPVCIECDSPFDTTTHKTLLEDLAKNIYLAELRHALYYQDSLHQFESKAHFDNCDFKSSIAYINELLAETDMHVQRALATAETTKKEEMKKAYFSLGQAMHAVQDFYAHSNYVELMASRVKTADDIETLEPWTPRGQDMITRLVAQNLVSGYVFWGFPQKCPKGSISHGDLAKDGADTKSGKVKIPHFQNQSQYKVAVFLARKTSITLMQYAFNRWPSMKEMGGNEMAFEVLVDRRGL